jgi:hypothetical protein
MQSILPAILGKKLRHFQEGVALNFLLPPCQIRTIFSQENIRRSQKEVPFGNLGKIHKKLTHFFTPRHSDFSLAGGMNTYTALKR